MFCYSMIEQILASFDILAVRKELFLKAFQSIKLVEPAVLQGASVTLQMLKVKRSNVLVLRNLLFSDMAVLSIYSVSK